MNRFTSSFVMFFALGCFFQANAQPVHKLGWIDLAELVEQGSLLPAPVALQQFALLESQYTEALIDCKKRGEFTGRELGDFFAAKKLKAAGLMNTFIVFPSRFECSDLFGVHKIPYMLVSTGTKEGYKLLHFGVTDYVMLVRLNTSRYPDLFECPLGSNDCDYFTFDGQQYRLRGFKIIE